MSLDIHILFSWEHLMNKQCYYLEALFWPTNDIVKTRLSELNDKTITVFESGPCNWLVLPLLLNFWLQQSSFRWIIHNRKKCSDSCLWFCWAYDSACDWFFYFQKVLSSLMTTTPTTTLTSSLSLVKTSNNPFPLLSIRQIENRKQKKNNRKTTETLAPKQ